MSCKERGGVASGTVLDSSGRRIDGEERLELIREQGRKYLDSYKGIFRTNWPKLNYWSDTSYLLGRLAMVEQRESKLESELGVLRLQLLKVSLDQAERSEPSWQRGLAKIREGERKDWERRSR